MRSTSVSILFQPSESPLVRLDNQLKALRGLDEWLSQTNVLTWYFGELQNYFGQSRFPRAAFDAIIGQLLQIKDRVPTLSQRLWDTRDLGEAFSITVSANASGRTLHTDNWEKFFLAWRVDLRRRAAGLASDEAAAHKVAELFSRWKKILSSAREDGRRRPSPDNIALNRAFSSDPDVLSATAWLLLRHLESASTRKFLASVDADSLISWFKHLRQFPRLFPAQGLSIPLRKFVPEMPTLLRRTDIFVPVLRITRSGNQVPLGRTKATMYTFQPVPRRLHGIWKGIIIKECVGGNLKWLGDLTPERWATIALDGSRVYYVERRYFSERDTLLFDPPLGFINLVPVDINGKIYGSVELETPVIADRCGELGVGGIPTDVVLDRFLVELYSLLPREWSGLVLSDSSALDDMGVLALARSHPSYLLGERLRPDVARHRDPIHVPLSHQIRRRGKAKQYGGRMIFDAVVPRAGALTVLMPPKSWPSANNRALCFRESLEKATGITRWRLALALAREGSLDAGGYVYLMECLEKTMRSRIRRWLDVRLGFAPANAYTAELWSETTLALGKWLQLEEEIEPSIRFRIVRLFQRAAASGKGPALRAEAERQLANLESIH